MPGQLLDSQRRDGQTGADQREAEAAHGAHDGLGPDGRRGDGRTDGSGSTAPPSGGRLPRRGSWGQDDPHNHSVPVNIPTEPHKLSYMVLDVRRLRVLREVARRGTIVAAADALGYTPSAVSQQLSTLEREAGVAVLERTGRNVRLTDEGETLVRHADADPRRARTGRGGDRARSQRCARPCPRGRLLLGDVGDPRPGRRLSRRDPSRPRSGHHRVRPHRGLARPPAR